jgi:hypothetical protein
VSIFQLLLAIIWLVAIVAIIRSPKTSGGEKIAWVLVTLFLSWIGFILYLLLAPLSSKRSEG